MRMSKLFASIRDKPRFLLRQAARDTTLHRAALIFSLSNRLGLDLAIKTDIPQSHIGHLRWEDSIAMSVYNEFEEKGDQRN